MHYFIPLSSSLLSFLIPSFTHNFGLCFYFPSAQPWISWTVSTENVSGFLSQISDKHEDRTVGCTSLSPTVPWKAPLPPHDLSDLFFLRLRVWVCVLKKQVCQENTELLYLIGRRQGVDGRNKRVLPKFRSVRISFLITNFLFSSFQRLQCFPAWKQKLICERWE